jgi:hypothetical protein
MQFAEQEPHQERRQRGNPNWVPGVSGNPAGRSKAARDARVAAKMAELAVEFGGVAALSSIDTTLLRQAAELLMRRPQGADDHVRIVNAVTRILGGIRLRHGKREQPSPLRFMGDGT